MANTSAAKKAIRVSGAKREVNNARKNRIRTFIRKVDDAVTSGDEAKAREAFKALEPDYIKFIPFT